jgi:hypothetical protein
MTMNTPIVIPAEEYHELKNRLRFLEQQVATLMEKVEKDAIFTRMVNSPAFQKDREDTIAWYQQDPSPFSDPFDDLRKYKARHV